jgi:hypothetical protein
MQKKYQVFIFSTFTDLIEERKEITKAILEMNHIPSGMEAFLSADEEQFSYIKKVIDQCDYYVLVIGGKYGSVAPSGKSYTEMEYDYAVATKKVVLACIHADVSRLPAGNVDSDTKQKELLEAFKSKVKTGRLVSFWNTKEELKSNIIISLSKAFFESPGVGWIRGDTAASEDVLSKLVSLQEENQILQEQIESMRAQNTPKVSGLAGLDEHFTVNFTFHNGIDRYKTSVDLSWGEIFMAIAPDISANGVRDFSESLKRFIIEKKEAVSASERPMLHGTDVDTIEVQMIALGLINSRGSDGVLSLTDVGKAKLIELMSIRSQSI